VATASKPGELLTMPRSPVVTAKDRRKAALDWIKAETRVQKAMAELAAAVQIRDEAKMTLNAQLYTKGISFTTREIQILNGLRDGLSNKEIGTRLSIEARTVKHHVSKIMRKTGTSSRLSLVTNL
jgi:DNA-binding NarL/FixJ family response regulator